MKMLVMALIAASIVAGAAIFLASRFLWNHYLKIGANSGLAKILRRGQPE